MAAFFFFVAIAASAATLAGYIYYMEQRLDNRLYPNITIDNVPVGRKTRSEVLALFREREDRVKKAVLSVVYESTPVATFSGSLLGLQTNMNEIYDKAYLVGRSSNAPSRLMQKILTLLGLHQFPFSSHVQYNKQYVTDTLSQFEDSYNRPAKNALFKFENDRVTSFAKEELGNRVLITELMQNIDQSVKSLKYQQQDFSFTLKQEPVQPEITLSKANGFGIEEEIGMGMSNYTHSIPTRIHNVLLAASKFNGVLIPKGETFSFDNTIGDISAQTGYQPAYIIKDGKTVLGDGGGVCQVSTTLFRAALAAGLPIVEQHPHAYRVSYYENDSKPGLDATVFAPYVDLKIKNDTDAAILIQTSADEDNMLLYFRLYGKKDGRNIEMSTPTLYDVGPPPDPLYQDDPTLKRGEVKQVDFAAWGGKTSFHYKVTRGDAILFEKQFNAVYRPWQAVFLVGTQD